MTDYNDILVGEIDPGSPITTSLMTRLRDNLLGVAEGSADTAPVPRVAVDLGGKTALATDETDASKVLRPDGAGGVEWGVEGATSPPHYARTGMQYANPGSGNVGVNILSWAGTEQINVGGWTFRTDGLLTVPESGVYMLYCSRTSAARQATLEATAPGSMLGLGLGNGGTANWEFTLPVRLVAGEHVRIHIGSGSGGSGLFNIGLVRV